MTRRSCSRSWLPHSHKQTERPFDSRQPDGCQKQIQGCPGATRLCPRDQKRDIKRKLRAWLRGSHTWLRHGDNNRTQPRHNNNPIHFFFFSERSNRPQPRPPGPSFSCIQAPTPRSETYIKKRGVARVQKSKNGNAGSQVRGEWRVGSWGHLTFVFFFFFFFFL